MGWGSGSRVFSGIIGCLIDSGVDHDQRVSIYKKMIQIFEEADCDTLHELYDREDAAFDEAYGELNPEWVEEMKENYDGGST